MIRLQPLPDVQHQCPHCRSELEVLGWYIPGMRTLADLRCPGCGRGYFGDLPAGHGLYYPMLIDKSTGLVHDRHGVQWFARWLRDSYASRTSRPIGLTVESLRPVRRPVLLNCLDRLYGHSLLKLLNAQYFLDHRPDLDLIVLIPRFLRWMVPDGVASIWTVDLPLSQGTEWNDWLASRIRSELEPFDECWLCIALSHPHWEDFSIERFTRVQSFPVERWAVHGDRPTVTYIWRSDRGWWGSGRLRWRRALGWAARRFLRMDNRLLLAEQMGRVVALAKILRASFPRLDFAIAGLGEPASCPDWITDLRTLQVTDHVEREWCTRYARSHVVIGVHGSNMLLPSAHAGAALELVPNDRWGNLVQDMIVGTSDAREALYRFRFLPVDTDPRIVGAVACSILRHTPMTLLNFLRPFTDHGLLQRDLGVIARRRDQVISSGTRGPQAIAGGEANIGSKHRPASVGDDSEP